MELKHITRILWASLILGWLFDFLFWKTSQGLNFFLFVLLTLGGGLLLSYGEGIKPSKQSLVLIVPILFFSAMFFIRQESMTSFLNFGFALGFMMLFTITLRNGLWMKYSLSDLAANLFRLGLGTLSGGSMLLSQVRKSGEVEGTVENGNTGFKVKPWAIIRGLLLAFPIVFILALLLASADPIFSNELNRLLNIDRWTEFAFRGIYILILAYLFSGVILYGLTRSNEDKLIGVEQPWLKPFLGVTEAAIILAGINLLFALFVGIQFKYFFGGQANIHLDGFTYAEYARRGFSELVFVAFLSLLVFLGLSTITRRTQLNQRRVFSGLGVGLVILVAVILVSAFQRLLLYESAYGFSRLRAYTHVFMIWLGILLAVTAVLEIMNRQRAFAIGALVVGLGFAITLNLLNVDAYIVRQNVARAEAGAQLDAQYLNGLSDDAVPAMFTAFFSTRKMDIKNELGAVLACISAQKASNNRPITWQGYHVSATQARNLLLAYTNNLQAYPVTKDADGFLIVKINGQERPCVSSLNMD